MTLKERLIQYGYLMRLDKPIGILLLLWPTLWAIWLASKGYPPLNIVFIFIAGVMLMRSAGCIVNDIADRHIDRHVKRTANRPLAANKISLLEAFMLASILLLIAFCLVLLCNAFTIMLAFIGALLTLIYPLLKRYTHLPQLGLGIAFAWGVPMAFAAINNKVPLSAILLFFTAMLWPLIYDTLYAMVDRSDDLKIGVKSTAILFGEYDKFILGLLQALFFLSLLATGLAFKLKIYYYFSLLAAAGFMIYQQYLIKDRDPEKCFIAFLNNNWLGLVIFFGIATSYLA